MKFIDSYYNQKNGYSCVYVQHLKRYFFGTAFLHPDDKENASEYAGCALAELRAQIKALKYERKLAKKKADQAIDFVKACECYKNFDKNSDTAKVIYRQLNRRIKKVNDLTDQINDLLEEVNAFAKRREIIINAMKRRKELSKEDK